MMRFVLSGKLRIPVEALVFSYAAYSGLAYYAFLVLTKNVLPINSGFIRLACGVGYLLLASLLYIRCHRKSVLPYLPVWPLSVKIALVFLVLTGCSFLWADSQGLKQNGIDLYWFDVGQWLVLMAECLGLLMICKVVPVRTVALSYLRGVRLGGLILAVTVLFFWLMGPKTSRLPVEVSKIIHPVWVSLKLAICLLCTFHLRIYHQDPKEAGNGKTIIYILPMLYVFLISFGKSSIIGFFLASIFYFSQVAGNWKLKKWIVTVCLLLIPLAYPFVDDFAQDYFSKENYLTLTGRTELWGEIIKAFVKKPFLGYGAGHPFPETSWSSKILAQSGQAHNQYLTVLYEMGLVGLIVLCFYFMLYYRQAMSALKKKKVCEQAILGLAIFIVMIVSSMTEGIPIGLMVPIPMQLLLLLWMSVRWNQEAPGQDVMKSRQHAIERQSEKAVSETSLRVL